MWVTRSRWPSGSGSARSSRWPTACARLRTRSCWMRRRSRTAALRRDSVSMTRTFASGWRGRRRAEARGSRLNTAVGYAVDDPLGLAAEHSSEEQLIASTVRDWVRRRFLPIVADAWRAGALPPELAPELGELVLLGMHLEGYGCAGTSATAYG